MEEGKRESQAGESLPPWDIDAPAETEEAPAGEAQEESEDADPGQSAVCPKCGSPLIIRLTRHGYYLCCSSYPACSYIRTAQLRVSIVKILPGTSCPLCGRPVAVKRSRWAMCIGCTGWPECGFIRTEREESTVLCPSCGRGHLRKHQTSQGKLFFSCDRYPDCSYRVTKRPVARRCIRCGFPIMLVAKGTGGRFLKCARRGCRYREPLTEELARELGLAAPGTDAPSAPRQERIESQGE